MATTRYPGDDPHRKLPDYAVVTLSGNPDGELGHILMDTLAADQSARRLPSA
jgi:hypothetical protein